MTSIEEKLELEINLENVKKSEHVSESDQKYNDQNSTTCTERYSISTSFDDLSKITNLNNFIQQLKSMFLFMMDLFNKSVLYLRKVLMKIKDQRETAKGYFELLESKLEDIKNQLEIVEKAGNEVTGFQGVADFLEDIKSVNLKIKTFCLQIKKNRITWKPEDVDSYRDQMQNIDRKIKNLQYSPTNFHDIVAQLRDNMTYIPIDQHFID